MHELDIENSLRKKTYDWFKSFKNPTYGINVTMDVTNLVNHSKKTKTSFFINMLYIVVNGLNEVPEMRMRFVDNKPVIFDNINPAITVMTENDVFENMLADLANIDEYLKSILDDESYYKGDDDIFGVW